MLARSTVRLFIVFGYLGPAGTFSHQALNQWCAQYETETNFENIPFATVGKALDAVRSGEIRAALVPIENSVEGGVSATLDNLAAGEQLMIIGEVLLPVVFCLAVRPGIKPQDIKTVISHPHAIAQVRNWMGEHYPDANLVVWSSTAAAAADLATGAAEAQGAICARVAAELYGLEVIAEDIHDNAAAVTRFAIVSKPTTPPAPTGRDKTTLVAYLAADRPGALLEILEQFATRGVNLCRIESRPTKQGLGNYCFSIDADGHLRDARMAEALQGLHRVCRDVVFLGSYPRADRRLVEVDSVFGDDAFRSAKGWYQLLVHPEE